MVYYIDVFMNSNFIIIIIIITIIIINIINIITIIIIIIIIIPPIDLWLDPWRQTLGTLRTGQIIDYMIIMMV
jgi:hypothetical protein